MANRISLSSFLKWLQSVEMFARPSKCLPGKWQLFEYYNESGAELVNIDEDQLRAGKTFMLLEITSEQSFQISENLKINTFRNINKGSWTRNRNFISLFGDEINERGQTFQFDAGSGQMKLLKKDSKGKIEFFGFFRRID